MDVALHMANVLYLVSYAVRDLLALRILSVLAGSFLAVYFTFGPRFALAPLAWNLLFIAMNMHRSAQIIRERRPVRLSEEEREIFRQRFQCLDPRDFIRLLRASQWRVLQAGECLAEVGSSLDILCYVHEGKLAVEKQGVVQREIGPGDLVGETMWVNEAPVTATLRVTTPGRVLCWERKRLLRLFHDSPAVHAAFQRVISRYLLEKMTAQRQAA